MNIRLLSRLRCYNCGSLEEVVSTTPAISSELPISKDNYVLFGSGVDNCDRCGKFRPYDGDKCLDELEIIMIDFLGHNTDGSANYVPIDAVDYKIVGE